MSRTLRDGLPAVYARLLPPFFDTPAPPEPKATCDDCAMCDKGAALPGLAYFRPDTKCCTYQPQIPNYLVGAVLADDDPAMEEGRRRVRAHIASRIGVTPRWLAPSRKRALLFRAARESSFGRSLLLRCPYYREEGGLCTIWRHREAVCSTFFCKYQAGADGQAFWRAVAAYLRHAEHALAAHAVARVAPSLVEPSMPEGQISLEDLEDRPPAAEAYASSWGDFEGREEDLYRAAFDVVSGLSREDLDRVVGGEDDLRALEAAHRRLVAPPLPDRLILDLYRPPAPVEDGVVVGSYSKYEPIKLTPDLFEVLRELSPDETVRDFRARLLRDHGVDVPEAMLVELHRLRVLIEP